MASSDTTQQLERRCAHCGSVVPAGRAFCSHCGASVERPAGDDPLLDRVRALFGRELEIERELGRGGMAVVYGAFDPELQRRVAVKVLLPEVAQHPELAERFRREARMAAALQHPNIVSVYGVRSDAEMSAIVMQLVDGRSLDVALRDDPRLPLPVAGLLLAQVAEALQHAHERGVVHRDIKPANVLLDHDGHAVVSDFGIARREGGTRITDTGVVMGTVAYMSPEQCLGAEVTFASDQYSFGIMAFELLAGRRPFADGSVIDMLRAQVNDSPPHLSTVRADIPEAVAAYVMRTLEKEPGARHRDLREARRVFGALVGDAKSTTSVIAGMSRARRDGGAVSRSASTIVPAVTVPLAAAQPTVPLAPAPASAPRGKAGTLAAIAAGVVIVAAGLAWAVNHRGTATPGVAPTASQNGSPAPTADARVAGSAALGAPAATGPARRANESAAGGGGAVSASATPGVSATPTTPGAARAASDPAASSAQTASLPRDTVVAPAAAVTNAPTVAPSPAASATLGDARSVAREFITICNQRRAPDLERLGTLDGDDALRAELLRRVRSAPDFAAGFERVASSPNPAGDRFTTEFVIDAEWRGGSLLATVKLQATQQGGVWHVSAFGVTPSP